MELHHVTDKLGLEQKFIPVLAQGWTSSMRTMPKGDFDFLVPAKITVARKACQMTPALDDTLCRIAKKIHQTPELRALAWHAYYLLITGQNSFAEWPSLTHCLDRDAGIFYLLIALGIVPKAQASYRTQNIPEDIIENTLLEIKGFCDNHTAAHQHPGLVRRQLAWLRNYLHGRLFRLERLEFKLEPFVAPFHVFRHIKKGWTVLLAPEGVNYNSLNLIDGVGEIFDEKGKWTSHFDETVGTVTGNPIDPRGYAMKRHVTLDRKDWENILPHGSWVLDMHIPPGGGLTPDICLKSFQKAVKFFREHFPEYPVKAINCGISWIFDHALERKLPDSNLAKFMRELYLYPCFSSGQDAVFFVFGKDLDDMENPPRNTRLQQMILDSLEVGEPLHASGMLFFPEDLKHWSTQYYRKQFLLFEIEDTEKQRT